MDSKNKLFFLRFSRLFIILSFSFFVLFYIGTKSTYLIKNIIKYICLSLSIIFLVLFIVFFIMYLKKKNDIKKTKLMNVLTCLYCICCIIFLFVMYGPFSGFRDWLITKSMGTMTHKYICKIFYNENMINEVFSKNYIEDTNEDSDTSLVVINEEANNNEEDWNEYEKLMFEGHTSDEIYRMIKFKVRGENAFLAVVYDPSNVSVECSKNVMKKGEYVVSMAQRTNALVAINGGRFYDPNHWSNGGIPTGVTIMDGKIITDRSYKSPMGVIAITNDNKLALYKNKTAQEVLDLGVRDAVTSKPFLIVNGKSMYTKGNGGYGYEARTAIGQRADGIMLLLVVEANDARTNGASMMDLTEVFENYGAVNAAALDGGTSSVMVEKGVLISDPINDPFVHETRKIATSIIVTKPNLVNETNVEEITNSMLFSLFDTLKEEYGEENEEE